MSSKNSSQIGKPGRGPPDARKRLDGQSLFGAIKVLDWITFTGHNDRSGLSHLDLGDSFHR